MVMGDAGYCACGCGCLRGLRHANLQGSKEEPQQKNGGSYGSMRYIISSLSERLSTPTSSINLPVTSSIYLFST